MERVLLFRCVRVNPDLDTVFATLLPIRAFSRYSGRGNGERDDMLTLIASIFAVILFVLYGLTF